MPTLNIQHMRKNKTKYKDEILNVTNREVKQSNLAESPKSMLLIWFASNAPQLLSPSILRIRILIGDLIIAVSLVLAAYIHVNYLLICIIGFVANWLSFYIDGKLIENKEGSESSSQNILLDAVINWISTLLISIGFVVYVGSPFFLFGVLLVILYSWRMVISLLHKVLNINDTIDSESLNSSQLKLLIILMIITEVFIPWSILYSAVFIIAFLMVTNIIKVKNLYIFK